MKPTIMMHTRMMHARCAFHGAAVFGKVSLLLSGLIGLITSAAFVTLASAKTEPWRMDFYEASSPLGRMIQDFHEEILFPLSAAIVVFVIVLIGFVCIRFRESANPTPSKTTHNTTIEVLWTLIPVLILVVLFIPSVRQIYASEVRPDSEMTLKIIGRQWYWSYEYPDHGNFTFDSILVPEEDLVEGQLRLMSTDNVVVLPIDTKIRLQMTASDVLHNWAISEFAVRMDTVPGRLNETWVLIEKAGTYYGFCSELCGSGHAYMPIEVRAVSKPEFDRWVTQAREIYEEAETAS